MCPGWYRQSSNAATIAFGMEIDVASYLDSAHGAISRLRGVFRALLDSADHRHHLGARGPLPIVNCNPKQRCQRSTSKRSSKPVSS
jgi:hypothetical protein